MQAELELLVGAPTSLLIITKQNLGRARQKCLESFHISALWRVGKLGARNCHTKPKHASWAPQAQRAHRNSRSANMTWPWASRTMLPEHVEIGK
eukprot:578668-Pelagomonas_calceolata.AAC.3